MKLKSVQTYQAVKFQGSNGHFFSKNDKAPDIDLNLHKDGYVTIKSAKDSIIVFTSNIAYVVAADSVGPATEKERGRLVDIDHTAPPKR